LDLFIGAEISQKEEVVGEDTGLPKLKNVSALLRLHRCVMVLVVSEGVAHCRHEGMALVRLFDDVVHSRFHAKVTV
jgi:hypothetical protein